MKVGPIYVYVSTHYNEYDSGSHVPKCFPTLGAYSVSQLPKEGRRVLSHAMPRKFFTECC